MVIDNDTNYPFLNNNSVMSEYGFELKWNAGSGAKELRHVEYLRGYFCTDIDKFRSRRRADIKGFHFNFKPFLDTKFLIAWTFRDEFFNLLHDNGLIVIRNAYLNEFL
jgi:hypothetical protein